MTLAYKLWPVQSTVCIPDATKLDAEDKLNTLNEGSQLEQAQTGRDRGWITLHTLTTRNLIFCSVLIFLSSDTTHAGPHTHLHTHTPPPSILTYTRNINCLSAYLSTVSYLWYYMLQVIGIKTHPTTFTQRKIRLFSYRLIKTDLWCWELANPNATKNCTHVVFNVWWLSGSRIIESFLIGDF